MTPLLPHLPTGRRNALSVADLARLTGMSSRAVRDELSRLARDEHQPLVCLPVAKGIYLAEDAADLDPVIADLRSRAGAMLRRARGLRMAKERIAWSPTLFEVE